MITNFFFFQAALGKGRGVVGPRPVFRADFQPVIKLAGLERFEGHAVIAKVIDGDGVEVVQALVDGQVFAPVVLVALVTDRAPGLDLGDGVGAAAGRDFQVAFVEVAGFPPVLGQYRELAKDQRQFAVFVVLEGEFDLQRVFRDGLIDIAVIALVQR